jgi:hypothetical protein
VDADAEGFAERALAGRDRFGEAVGEVDWPRDVLGERAVVRRGRHERHVGTAVVLAAFAVVAPAAGDAGFERDAVSGFEVGHSVADRDHLARALVTQNQWLLDHVIADSAVFVVVEVRPADADFADSDEDLVGRGVGPRTLLDFESPGFFQDCGAHGRGFVSER